MRYLAHIPISDLAKRLLGKLGIGVTSYNNLLRLKTIDNAKSYEFLELLQYFSPNVSKKVLEFLPKSNSQIRQDLFVLGELNFKQNGFFVEFGAADGIKLSNTFLMENFFGWKGILAEPAYFWRKSLLKNRPNSKIEELCVWKTSGETLTFNEVAEPELSTISEFSNLDKHKGFREDGKAYEVETISLADMLKKHHAPKHIDYLSIDTEGSEYEILKTFDFGTYTFSVITCEHNFTANRDKIRKLLRENGYLNVLTNISSFDDWFVLEK
jgi:FkbM family methyltransferase